MASLPFGTRLLVLVMCGLLAVLIGLTTFAGEHSSWTVARIVNITPKQFHSPAPVAGKDDGGDENRIKGPKAGSDDGQGTHEKPTGGQSKEHASKDKRQGKDYGSGGEGQDSQTGRGKGPVFSNNSSEPFLTAVDGPTRLVMLTYTDSGTPKLCNFVKSAAEHGLRINVIGWHGPHAYWPVHEYHLGSKVTRSAAFIEKYIKGDPRADDTVMMLTDATDVFFQRSADRMLEAFKGLKKPIVFSTEPGVWPANINGKNIAKSYPPHANDPYHIYPFLNSGGWMGYAGPMLDWLTEWQQTPKDWKNFGVFRFRDGKIKKPSQVTKADRKIPPVLRRNDQVTAQLMYIANPDRVALDTRAQIFQSVFLSPKLMKMHLKRTDDWVLHNKITDTTPAVVHYNGGAKRWTQCLPNGDAPPGAKPENYCAMISFLEMARHHGGRPTAAEWKRTVRFFNYNMEPVDVDMETACTKEHMIAPVAQPPP